MSLGTSRSECTHSAGRVGGSGPLGWIQVHSWGQRWPRAWCWVFILTLYAEQCLITSSSEEAKLLGLRAPQRAQMCALSHFSCVRLFAILWTIVGQAPLSMGFSRQEYWSGLPCPPPGDLPNPRIEPASLMSPALAGGFLRHLGIPKEPKSHDWKQRCSIKNGLGSLRARHLGGAFHFSFYFQVVASHPPYIYSGSVLLSSVFHLLLSLSLSLSFSLKNQWAAVFQLHRVSAFLGKLRQRPRKNEPRLHRGSH